MNKSRWVKTGLLWILVYLPSFVLTLYGFSLFGLGLSIVFGLMLNTNQDFRGWLYKKRGFRNRLAKLPLLSLEPSRNNSIFLTGYFLVLAFVSWLIFGITHTDNIGVDLILGLAGLVLFFGWFVEGWLSKGKEESIDEEEQEIKLATIIPELSTHKIINYLRSNVIITVALICALLSPFLCVGSSKILYKESSERTAYVQEQSTDTRSPDIECTQTPHVVVITSTTIPSTPTETITLTPIPLATISLDKEKAQVIEIVDGDTIKVSISGSEYSVRYIGIDTPEVQYDEWFGKEARDANVELVAGKEVLLEKDVSETDQYDRLLRYVYLLDGTFVNAELVRRGFAIAKAYPPDTKYQDLLEALEQGARDEGLGLWQMTSTPEPIATTTSGASVQIILVDKRAEYVDIQNIGNQIVSIDGWTLRSDKGDQDCVLSGSLAAGEVLRIWALAEDSDQEGYCCWFGSNIWNNSELDPAVLFDDAFNEIDRYP